MKREYVIPDFLAAVTADALLAGRPTLRADERAVVPSERRPTSLAWLKRVARRLAQARSRQPVQLSFDDEWAGGWYARARHWLAAGTRSASTRLPEELK
jgi:hypothetical protein